MHRHFFIGMYLLLSCVLSPLFAQNQDQWKLNIEYTEDMDWLKRIDYPSKLSDSIAVYNELEAVVSKLYKKSYLAAALDSVVFNQKSITAYVFVGERLNWARLSKGNMEEEVLSKTGYRDKIYNRYRFRYKQFGRFTENILEYYENHGYPFASLQLDSIKHLENQGISASLKLEKNKYVMIDTIEVYGADHVSYKYFQSYLNIKPGKAYNESSVSTISSRIRDLSFVSEQKPPKVIFTETKTTLQLFLNKKRASRFDGIVGLLQDEETGQVQFTGDIKLNLTNIFRRGEIIALNWRGLPNQTQDLNVMFNYPYLFNSPFGFDLKFRLYRRDTTFLDVISTFGILYYLNARDYLKVIYQNHQSGLISTSQYEGQSSLPSVLDFTSNMYGVELNFNKLDYLLNPTRGYRILLNGMTGFKNIRKNPSIDDSLYNVLDLNQVNFRGEGNVGYFYPVSRRHVIFLGNQTAFLHNPQILQNELFRIGGLKTLRGFNEETIFVSMYTITTLEYRFILEKNSYLNAFIDMAYTEQKVFNKSNSYDRPYGFGVGTAFETGAGIFSLSYAVGSQQGNPVDLRGAKIHFGFLNFF